MNNKGFIIKKDQLSILLKKFQDEYIVYGPIKPGLDSSFGEILTIEQLHLEYQSTVLPPKKYFLPSKETLFSFTINKKTIITQEQNNQKILLFGVHPCDAHAIFRLDTFFSTEFEDIPYLNKRKNTVIVALNCVEPSETSFCKYTKTGPFLEKGFDLILTDIGTKYLLEIGSNIGRNLIKDLNLQKATAVDYEEKEKRFTFMEKKFKKFIDISWLPRIAHENFDNEVWRKLGEHGGVAESYPCLSCGSCTFVCPTCYCFDIYDSLDITLKNGTRTRELDSCQLLEYGEVALGGNFRRDRTDRIRHWMMCKFGAAAGGTNSSCVGCGRCIRICPSKIDITEVAKELRRGV
ncbi:MAG: 4Fe-4S dicluster domain-containing protein [Candidatus Thermoplasmatota archaeon]|nr:4Fe-4S dicluster domain-containing protein [Candidatus Thermoplasmatota archaeon]